jgi:hypothetical protein
MIGAIFYLLKDICLKPILNNSSDGWISVTIAFSTFLMLQKTKLPAPLIVLICLIIGFLV